MTAPEQVVFVAAHRPRLPAGEHVVHVGQRVWTGPEAGPAEAEHSLQATVHVRGPRTTLPPDVVESRFPASGHGGADAAVLPHVVLTRSTLPWERTAQEGSDLPWLAVLLVTEADAATVVESVQPLSALWSASTSPAFPGLHREPGEQPDDPVRVLDVPAATLSTALPERGWLSHLAHVRERFVDAVPSGGALVTDLDAGRLPAALDGLLRRRGRAVAADAVRVEVPGHDWRLGGDDPLRAELRAGELILTAAPRAVVLGCRLTRAATPAQRYRAYLVSLEHRFDASGHFAGLAGPAPVRLVLLDSWAVEVDAAAGDVEDRLTGLSIGHVPAVFTGERAEPGPDLHLGQAGFALVRHVLRDGAVRRSWYRGPLGSRYEFEPPVAAATPRSADDLLLVEHTTDLLITSYAAAWELGRMLVVADPAVSLDLVRWRSEHRRYTHRVGTAEPQTSLHVPRDLRPPELPTTLTAVLRRLLVLEGIPFGYLVPDPAMLPVESMRTFVLDPTWMRCLLQGALAVGQRPERGRPAEPTEEEALLVEALDSAGRDLQESDRLSVSGCLIRSSIVSDWPALRVDAWAAERVGIPPDRRCPVVRRTLLSPDVLLVLFHGVAGRIEVAPNPEALHHGLHLRGNRWTRAPRGGGMSTGELTDGDRIPVDELRAGLTPDAFAQLMVRGVPTLRIVVP